MERIYELLLTAGYPSEGIDWLRKHRAATIFILATCAWGLVIGLGWIVWSILA